MDQILMAVTAAAVCMVAISSVMMMVVCSRFLSAVSQLIAGAGLAAAPAIPAAPVAQAYAPPVYSPLSSYSPPAPVAEMTNLHDVDEKTAAMLMAIVAAEEGAAPEDLRFISIKGL